MTQNIIDYMARLGARKREAGKESTADLYCVVSNRLRCFTKNSQLPFTAVTVTLIDAFAASLHAEGLAVNTVNSYLSTLRAAYHHAVRAELFEPGKDPFVRLHLRREETAKRAIPAHDIRKIMQAGEQEENASLCYTLDFFIFSFLACGMPFIELAYLTGKNIVGNEIVYHRHKTGTLVRIGITPAMRILLDRYRRKGACYLFPVLREGKDSYTHYKTALKRYNKQLKEIGRRLHIPGKLTSYVARHSWATEALRKNTPVAQIGQAMGHTSEKATRFYLAQLDQSTLNKANAKITKEFDKLITRKRA